MKFNKMRTPLFSLFIMVMTFISCDWETQIEPQQVLEASKKYYDPQGQWNNSMLDLHIIEPRISNPARYSKITFNNKDQSFVLERNRDEHISLHMIDSIGEASVTLDGLPVQDSLTIAKYRLNPERNFGYRAFYQKLIGLPMSIYANELNKNIKSSVVIFDKRSCHQLNIQLEEAIISKAWKIYVDCETYELIGLEILSAVGDQEGERIYFEGEVDVNGMLLPRMRHWYSLGQEVYRGSDIIINSNG